RDHGKRSLMGSVSSKFANHIIITSDNPREEDPQLIADMIAEGIEETVSFEVILDRDKAIAKAIKQLTCNETLVIIGKGHEDYQIIGDKRVHFSDEEEVNKCIT
ncbi:MAG: UDP-N-acetylmuramoyl-L-alanyl-D-glutamate--2,6-diaminopimelate ligase, partial [Candidatus Marinimicrobia bacterium]|nr:UDP-N-acetylmuramoyl-L-alanyl-D-glutamate--2,6-diaminopimelate ligase [Candidatus Neomarinimicrobiota bacterium]